MQIHKKLFPYSKELYDDYCRRLCAGRKIQITLESVRWLNEDLWALRRNFYSHNLSSSNIEQIPIHGWVFTGLLIRKHLITSLNHTNSFFLGKRSKKSRQKNFRRKDWIDRHLNWWKMTSLCVQQMETSAKQNDALHHTVETLNHQILLWCNVVTGIICNL